MAYSPRANWQEDLVNRSRNPITGVAMTPPSKRQAIRQDFMLVRGVDVLSVVPTQHPGVWTCTEDAEGVPKGAMLVVDQRRKGALSAPAVAVYKKGAFALLRGLAYAEGYYHDKIETVEMSIESLGWALTVSWEADLASPEEIEEYAAVLAHVYTELASYRDEKIADAAWRAQWASVFEDVLQRFNPMSRAAIICAAIRRLEGWINAAPFFVRGIDSRKMAVIAEIDDAESQRLAVLTELVEMARWWNPERIGRVDAEQALKLAARVDACVERLRTVDIAPYATHSFPHTIGDLEAEAGLLREFAGDRSRGTLEVAGKRHDIAQRALTLLGYAVPIEQMLTTVAVMERYGRTPSPEVLASFEDAINVLLDGVNTTLDEGFERRVVEDTRRNLDLARLACGANHETALLNLKTALTNAARPL